MIRNRTTTPAWMGTIQFVHENRKKKPKTKQRTEIAANNNSKINRRSRSKIHLFDNKK